MFYIPNQTEHSCYRLRIHLEQIKLNPALYRDDLVHPLAVSLGLKSAVPHGGQGIPHTTQVWKAANLYRHNLGNYHFMCTNFFVSSNCI